MDDEVHIADHDFASLLYLKGIQLVRAEADGSPRVRFIFRDPRHRIPGLRRHFEARFRRFTGARRRLRHVLRAAQRSPTGVATLPGLTLWRPVPR